MVNVTVSDRNTADRNIPSGVHLGVKLVAFVYKKRVKNKMIADVRGYITSKSILYYILDCQNGGYSVTMSDRNTADLNTPSGVHLGVKLVAFL